MSEKNEIPIQIKDSRHQPSKAEMEKEYDMPRADIETLRRAFFQSVRKQKTEASEALL